LREEV